MTEATPTPESADPPARGGDRVMRGLLLLASGRTPGEVATALNVSDRTIRRWKTHPKFRAKLDELRRGIIDQASARLADGLSEATDTLKALLKADSDHVKLGAARSFWEYGIRVIDQNELRRRLEELEGRLGAGAGPAPDDAGHPNGEAPPWAQQPATA